MREGAISNWRGGDICTLRGGFDLKCDRGLRTLPCFEPEVILDDEGEGGGQARSSHAAQSLADDRSAPRSQPAGVP